MNFLPFLLVFMTAISLYSSLLFLEAKSYMKQLSSLEKKNHLNEKAQLSYQLTYFQYQKGKINYPKRTHYINFRNELDHYERSKCNLAVCFKTKQGMEFLKTAFLSIYPSFFLDEKELVDFLETWKGALKKMIQVPIPFSFYQIHFENLNDARIYKALLEGKSKSFPLETLFLYDEKGIDKPLCFRYAQTLLFEAALGKELSLQILDFERSSYRNPNKKLTKEELFKFLTDQGMNKEKINSIFSLFTFKEPKKKLIHIIEKNEKLGLESKLYNQLFH